MLVASRYALSTTARIRWLMLATGAAWAVEYLILSCFKALAKELGITEGQAADVNVWFAIATLVGGLLITTWLGPRVSPKLLAPASAFVCAAALDAATYGSFGFRCWAIALAGLTSVPLLSLVQASIQVRLLHEGFSTSSIEGTLTRFVLACMVSMGAIMFWGRYELVSAFAFPLRVTAIFVACGGVIMGCALWNERPKPTSGSAMLQALRSPVVVGGLVLQIVVGIVLKALDGTQQAVLEDETTPGWLEAIARLTPLDAKSVFVALPTTMVVLGGVLAALWLKWIVGTFTRILWATVGIAAGIGLFLVAETRRGTDAWLALHLGGHLPVEKFTTELSSAGVAGAVSRVPSGLAHATAALLQMGKQAGGLLSTWVISIQWHDRADFVGMMIYAGIVACVPLLLLRWMAAVFRLRFEHVPIVQAVAAVRSARDAYTRVVGAARSGRLDAATARPRKVEGDTISRPPDKVLRTMERRRSVLLTVELDGAVLVMERVRRDRVERVVVWDSRLTDDARLFGPQTFADAESAAAHVLAAIDHAWVWACFRLEDVVRDRSWLPVVPPGRKPRPLLSRRGTHEPLMTPSAVKLHSIMHKRGVALAIPHLPPEVASAAGERVLAFAYMEQRGATELVLLDSAREGKPVRILPADALERQVLDALKPLSRAPGLPPAWSVDEPKRGPDDDGYEIPRGLPEPGPIPDHDAAAELQREIAGIHPRSATVWITQRPESPDGPVVRVALATLLESRPPGARVAVLDAAMDDVYVAPAAVTAINPIAAAVLGAEVHVLKIPDRFSKSPLERRLAAAFSLLPRARPSARRDVLRNHDRDLSIAVQVEPQIRIALLDRSRPEQPALVFVPVGEALWMAEALLAQALARIAVGDEASHHEKTIETRESQ